MVMRKKSAKNTDSISELSVWRFWNGTYRMGMESLFFSSVCDWTGKKFIFISHGKRFFGHFFYYYAFFAFLTLLSFNVLALVLIPAWFMLLYQFFIALKWMENFNISKVKTTVYSALIETGFVAAAPYVRKFLWWFVSDFLKSLILP